MTSRSEEALAKLLGAGDPVPRDIHDALLDSQFRAGVQAGWNAAMIEDPQASEERLAVLCRVDTGALDPILRRNRDRGRRWRHKKRGSTYVEVARALLQASNGPPAEDSTLVIYRSDDGGVFAREQQEFEDGRFELLERPPC